jgi:hypothetical protein
MTAILDKILGLVGIELGNGVNQLLYAAWMILGNVLVGWLAISILEKFEEKSSEKRKRFEPRPVAVPPSPQESE